jgi:PPM family protein phosphatase
VEFTTVVGAVQEMRIREGIELGNLTDVGCHREENQDSYSYAEPDSDQEFEKKGRLVLVADGMGGYEGGAMASSIAADVIRSTYAASSSDDPEPALVEAMVAAHLAIRNYAREHPQQSKMGTTCTAAVLRHGHLIYGHVGDSRLYLMRAGQITRLTRDMTVTERLVEQGVLRPEEMSTHPDRHVLTAAMGVGEAVAADFPESPIALAPDDILLLCTDGLYDLVSDEEMLSIAGNNSAADACKQLVATAKERGGYDNITVQILKIQPR